MRCVRRFVGLCIVCIMVSFGVDRVILVIVIGLLCSVPFIGLVVAVGIVYVLDRVLQVRQIRQYNVRC